nr:MAG TPA: hypothetical protein [Caudoviricetes sp.]
MPVIIRPRLIHLPCCVLKILSLLSLLCGLSRTRDKKSR